MTTGTDRIPFLNQAYGPDFVLHAIHPDIVFLSNSDSASLLCSRTLMKPLAAALLGDHLVRHGDFASGYDSGVRSAQPREGSGVS
jgi:hypothetical protein